MVIFGILAWGWSDPSTPNCGGFPVVGLSVSVHSPSPEQRTIAPPGAAGDAQRQWQLAADSFPEVGEWRRANCCL